MANPSLPPGKTLLSWKTLEYPDHERGRLWYIIAIVIGLALLIYAFATTNYLFAIIIIIFGIILTLSGLRKPDTRDVRLTETGIFWGEQFYPYRDMDRFAIIYQPPDVKHLYLEFRGAIRPRLAFDLEGQDPTRVRELLLEHVREDAERTDEPFTDFMARLLKL